MVGDFRYFVFVEKCLLLLESVEICVCCNFLISILMVLLGSFSICNIEVMVLMVKRLFIFGLFVEVFFCVISIIFLLWFIVVFR